MWLDFVFFNFLSRIVSYLVLEFLFSPFGFPCVESPLNNCCIWFLNSLLSLNITSSVEFHNLNLEKYKMTFFVGYVISIFPLVSILGYNCIFVCLPLGDLYILSRVCFSLIVSCRHSIFAKNVFTAKLSLKVMESQLLAYSLSNSVGEILYGLSIS